MPTAATTLRGSVSPVAAPLVEHVVGELVGPATPVEVRETHSAVVVLAGDRAYKVRKPVDLGFLDFTTLAQRTAACEEELALNRRLAPDVYLGIVDLHDADGAVDDRAVVMRRMPDDHRLAACIERGDDVAAALRDVARQVAVLHAAPPSGPSLLHVATQAAIRRRWTDGFEQMRPFSGAMFDAERQARIEWLATRFVDGRADLFAERIDRGHVRDGHGDLLTDDIFLLADGPRILDCLDFDAELRWGDVLGDVAFLAMDLERLGRPDAASRFLADYREFAAENWSAPLAHHLIAYRAHVRAKVAALKAAQTGRFDPEVEHLQRICLEHLEAGRVRLVMVGGLPGTGKSTLAEALGDRLGAVVVRTDEVRRDLVADGELDLRDHYTGEAVDTAYRRTLRRAERLLRRGEIVVVDASWSADRHRDAALALARSTSTDLVELECRAPSDVCRRRIVERLARGSDPSEATPAVADAMAARFAPWRGATAIDTSRSPATALADALATIDALA